MKRWLFALCLAVPVLLLALPWYVGRQAELAYRNFAAEDGVTLAAFQRGWFASTARLAIDARHPWLGPLAAALGSEGEGTLVLRDHIAHGPLPVAAREPGARWRPALVAVHSEGPAGFGAAFRMLLDGSIAGEAGLKSAAGPLPGLGHLAVDGLRLGYRAPPGGDRVALDLRAAQLVAAGNPAGLAAEDMELSLELARSASGLWSGRAQGRATRLVLGEGERRLDFGGLSFQSDTRREGERFGADLRIHATSLLGPNRRYGPGDVDVSLQALDADAVTRLQDTLARLAARGLAGRELGLALAGALYAEAPRLLRHRPRLALRELTLAAPEGAVKARGDIELASADPRVLGNPYLLRRAVTARLDAAVPVALGERLARLYLAHRPGTPAPDAAEAWLARQVERGALALDESAYRLELRYASERITINGRPWPPETNSSANDAIPER